MRPRFQRADVSTMKCYRSANKMVRGILCIRSQEGSMRLLHLSQTLLCYFAALCLLGSTVSVRGHSNSTKEAKSSSCPNDDAGLKLPAGFCATVFADGIGHARHIVVSPSGVVYVNTWSGRYYGNDVPPAGGFLVALEDKTGAGKADIVERFGETAQNGGAGG